MGFELGGAFKALFIMCALLGGLAVAAVWGLSKLGESDEIRSTEKLVPIRTELTIVNNNVVPVYIYKKPKAPTFYK